MRKYFKLNPIVNVIDYVSSWRSKGISNESINPPTTTDNSLSPKLSYYGTEIRVQFTGSCLKQPKFYVYPWKTSKYLHCLWIKRI